MRLADFEDGLGLLVVFIHACRVEVLHELIDVDPAILVRVHIAEDGLMLLVRKMGHAELVGQEPSQPTFRQLVTVCYQLIEAVLVHWVFFAACNFSEAFPDVFHLPFHLQQLLLLYIEHKCNEFLFGHSAILI